MIKSPGSGGKGTKIAVILSSFQFMKLIYENTGPCADYLRKCAVTFEGVATPSLDNLSPKDWKLAARN